MALDQVWWPGCRVHLHDKVLLRGLSDTERFGGNDRFPDRRSTHSHTQVYEYMAIGPKYQIDHSGFMSGPLPQSTRVYHLY